MCCTTKTKCHQGRQLVLNYKLSMLSMLCLLISKKSIACQSTSVSSDLVPELESKHVHIRDPEFVKKAIEHMMKDGAKKLQIVADFDRTLSKYKHQGQVCATCHNVLEESHVMPDFFKEQATALRDKYIPLEFSHDLTVEQKIPLMIEWYKAGVAMYVGSGIRSQDVSVSVAKARLVLRDGCMWFFDELHQHQIPLLIFSAGIGDIIEEVITQQARMHDNMKIVSNFMDFDSEGKLIGFKGEMIHTYNKNENAVHDSDYFKRLKHHENLILLGDSLGDLRMAEGAEVTHMLKIGFLNHHVETNLKPYMDSFDIVIQEDESMDVVNAILKTILGQ
ncbi:cytosolic 5'-nucleotidase 3-like isoform X2 [Haliotis asinina]|uniref:cytosolic 5'-nucleotidase 3-like isoform X2 n=1 Tax=Haliotis asinina TaxID=109174 RepID=UPI003532276A